MVMTARLSQGLFITFEGGEGAGKSTQIRRLHARLQARSIKTQVTREPGGTPGAELIRALILDGTRPALDALTETLLFYAARANHLAEFIRPALARGDVVLCDRFSDSTRVYQGVLGAVPSAVVEQLEALVVAETKPDWTIILDIPPETGLARASQRRGSHQADRFESETLEFHKKLRQGFLDLAERDPDRIVVVSALGDEEQIEIEILKKLSERFSLFERQHA
jgi:dTMP kinase